LCSKSDAGVLIHVAAFNGNKELLNYLIDIGIPINLSDITGCSPLHYSVQEKLYLTTDFLLQRGADPNHINKESETPLFIAARQADQKSLRLLLKAGALLDHANARGLTPRQIIMQEIDRTANQQLIDILAGPLPVVVSSIPSQYDKQLVSDSDTDLDPIIEILFEALDDSDVAAVKRLLGEDPQRISCRNEYGFTLLYEAVLLDEPKIIEVLLDSGADRNAMSDNGETPLAAAKRLNRPHLALLLSGESSDQLAESAQRRREKGKEVVTDSDIDSENDHMEDSAIMDNLDLNDLNAVDETGNTLLHDTIRDNDLDSTLYLLHRGVNLTANAEGENPIQLAVRLGRWDLLNNVLRALVGASDQFVALRNQPESVINNTLPALPFLPDFPIARAIQAAIAAYNVRGSAI